MNQLFKITIKVHKAENVFGSDFDFFAIFALKGTWQRRFSGVFSLTGSAYTTSRAFPIFT
jgi:hypothetical protein